MVLRKESRDQKGFFRVKWILFVKYRLLKLLMLFVKITASGDIGFSKIGKNEK